MNQNNPLIISSEEREIDTDTASMLRRSFMPDHLVASPAPTLYAMAGIPGCGKSVYVDRAIERGEFPRNAVMIDPDRVMQLIPDYLRDLADRGAEKAYQRWTMPARNFAYEMFEAAGQKRLDIVQDMGSARQEMYDRLQRFKDMGYTVKMIYVHCPLKEAVRRLQGRARFTPRETIEGREKILRELLPQYRALCDQFVVLDNSDPALPFQISTLEQVGLA